MTLPTYGGKLPSVEVCVELFARRLQEGGLTAKVAGDMLFEDDVFSREQRDDICARLCRLGLLKVCRCRRGYIGIGVCDHDYEEPGFGNCNQCGTALREEEAHFNNLTCLACRSKRVLQLTPQSRPPAAKLLLVQKVRLP